MDIKDLSEEQKQELLSSLWGTGDKPEKETDFLPDPEIKKIEKLEKEFKQEQAPQNFGLNILLIVGLSLLIGGALSGIYFSEEVGKEQMIFLQDFNKSVNMDINFLMNNQVAIASLNLQDHNGLAQTIIALGDQCILDGGQRIRNCQNAFLEDQNVFVCDYFCVFPDSPARE